MALDLREPWQARFSALRKTAMHVSRGGEKIFIQLILWCGTNWPIKTDFVNHVAQYVK